MVTLEQMIAPLHPDFKERILADAQELKRRLASILEKEDEEITALKAKIKELEAENKTARREGFEAGRVRVKNRLSHGTVLLYGSFEDYEATLTSPTESSVETEIPEGEK